MNFNNLLNQILGTVQKNSKSVADSPLNSFGGGALVAGLASMLMKKKNTKGQSRFGRSFGLYCLQRLSKLAAKPQPTRIAATSASDGSIDETEKQVIARESGTDAETAAWLAAEYERPATVEEIAAAVGNDEALAAETYLAARLVCADLSRKEIVFLSRLSQALKLDDQLVENLEKQLDLA